MTKQIPLIKKIKTGNGYYVYDVSNNEILTVDRVAYDLFEDFFLLSEEQLIGKHKSKYQVDEIREVREYLREKTDQGYFSSQRPEFDTDSFLNNGKTTHEQHFRDILLIPCDDCNLRCEYCIYSGTYTHNRKHHMRKMTVDTAAKAIKRLKMPDKHQAEKYHQLHFFGGEPLLNLDILKFCKKETDRLAREGRKIKLIIETNGILLTPEITDYLVKGNFFLSISLDGPKELHDRYRVKKNGTGSFDALIKNLKYIKENYPEYYANISFTSVLSPPFYEEFKRHLGDIVDLIRDNRITYSRVNPFGTSFFSPEDLEQIDRYMDDLRETFVNSMCNDSGDEDFFLKSYFLKSLIKSMGFMIKADGKTEFKKSICNLGGQKALVDTEGNLTPCLEYWSKNISMGHVDTGFNMDTVDQYMKEFCDEVVPHCNDCWLIRHCQLCPPLFLEKNTISQQKRERLCRVEKEKHLKDLQMTLSIIEKNPGSLKYMEDYKALRDVLPAQMTEKEEG